MYSKIHPFNIDQGFVIKSKVLNKKKELFCHVRLNEKNRIALWMEYARDYQENLRFENQKNFFC